MKLNLKKIALKFPLLTRILLVGTVIVIQGEVKSENDFQLTSINEDLNFQDESILYTPSKKNMKILSSITSNEIKEDDEDLDNEDDDEYKKTSSNFFIDNNLNENEDFLPFDSNGNLKENESIYDIDLNELIYHFKNSFKKILEEKMLKYLKLFFKQQFYISPFTSSILPHTLQNDYYNSIDNFINKEAAFSYNFGSATINSNKVHSYEDINSINKNKFNLPTKNMIIRPLLIFSHELQHLVKSQNLSKDKTKRNHSNINSSNKIPTIGIKSMRNGRNSINNKSKYDFDIKNSGIKQLIRRHNLDFSLFLDFIYNELDVASSCFESVNNSSSTSNCNNLNSPMVVKSNSPYTNKKKNLSFSDQSTCSSDSLNISINSTFSFPPPPFLPNIQTSTFSNHNALNSPYTSPLLNTKYSLRQTLLKSSIISSSNLNNTNDPSIISNSNTNINGFNFPLNFLPNYSINLSSKNFASDPTIEPIFNLFLFSLYKRRTYFLSSNSLNFACILIQRIYRGYYARLKIKYFLDNYTKYQLKVALGFYGYKKWQKYHLKYLKNIIKIQSCYLMFKYQKLFKLKLFYISRLQRNIKIFLLKLRIKKKFNKNYNKNRIIYMLNFPKEILLNKKNITIWIFRCGNNYRVDGIDLIDNNFYTGVIYENELKSLINNYNKEIFQNELNKFWESNKELAQSLQNEFNYLYSNNNDININSYNSIQSYNPSIQSESLNQIFSTSKSQKNMIFENSKSSSSLITYTKNLIEKKFLKLWQYEKVCDFLIENINFIRGINIPTKDLQKVNLPYLPLHSNDQYYKIIDGNEKDLIMNFKSPIQENISFTINKNNNLQFIFKLKSSQGSFLDDVFSKTTHNLTTKGYHENNTKVSKSNSLIFLNLSNKTTSPLPNVSLPLPLNDDITKHPYIKYLQRDLNETVESKKLNKKSQINKLLKDFNNTKKKLTIPSSSSINSQNKSSIMTSVSTQQASQSLMNLNYEKFENKKELTSTKIKDKVEDNNTDNQNLILNTFLLPKLN